MRTGRIVFQALFLLIFLCLFSAALSGAAVTDDPCQTCPLSASGSNTVSLAGNGMLMRFFMVGALVALTSLFLWRSYRKKIYPLAGLALIILLAVTGVYTSGRESNTDNACSSSQLCSQTAQSFTDTASGDEFKPADSNEFINADSDEFVDAGSDEFISAEGDEFTAVGSDEFKTAEGAESGGADSLTQLSEFTEAGDEFSSAAGEEKPAYKPYMPLLIQVCVLFILGVLISLLLKYKWLHNMRFMILLFSVIYLGFYKGGCPCMIMSFQDVILFITGKPVVWISMLWFLMLLPLTYFFGKVWCGWLCHLGALQEFLFRNRAGGVIRSARTQKILKYVQTALLMVLLAQLVITRTNLFVKVDPFKVAFNLHSVNITGYILLAILLLSSLFVYRPFCRVVCPVGLILGWVSQIPGAYKISVNDECNSCQGCVNVCKQHAITKTESGIVIDNDECILCGDCIHRCKRESVNGGSLLISTCHNKSEE